MALFDAAGWARVTAHYDTTRPPIGEAVRRHIFELAVSLGWAAAGISYLIDPSATALHSPLGGEVPHLWTYIWSVLYLVGGPATAYGLLSGRVDFRIAGLSLLAGGLGMHGFVVLISGDLEPRSFIYWIYGVACAARAVLYVYAARRNSSEVSGA